MMNVSGGTETAYYYHFDGLGSVTSLSNSSGGIVERYSYDVFGEPNRVSSIGNPYLFTGRQYDEETGNYYYRARYYKPSMGRFLQIDSLGYYDSANLYQYCGNNPASFIDPSGLKIEIIGDKTAFQQASTYLSKSPTYNATLGYLESQPDTYYVVINNDSDNRFGYHTAQQAGVVAVYWDPKVAVEVIPQSDIEPKNKTLSPSLGLAHELEHMKEYILNKGKLDMTPLNNGYDTKEEQRVIVGPERQIAMELGESLRHNHKGKPFFVDNPTKRCKK